ncbi:RNA polymerase sigma factor [Patescibacteria group bacterium]|nr:RNA polymerase sigma factor [Patescibacteria group bacterium]
MKEQEARQITDKQIEELVKLSQKGDVKAFAQIYDVFVKSIYRYVFYKVKKEDVEDIVEVLFLKAWENIRKYKKRKNTTFKSWIFRIAHNLIVDHYRLSREHASLDPWIADTKREANPIDMTQCKLNTEFLKEALAKLKPNYQQLIIYKFINDFSNEEIAQLLDKSEGSIRILQFRALKSLKQILKDMGVQQYQK